MTTFTFTSRDLGKLFSLNYFEIPNHKIVLFALRGCQVVDLESAMTFSDKHELKLVETDHEYLKCTIGQWRPYEGTFSLYPGSTIPHKTSVKKAKEGGPKTNQLMTGLYKKYRKGRHKGMLPNSHDAIRTDAKLLVRRTFDDLNYELQDPFEHKKVYDNIHASYCKSLDHKHFESAGCQVIMGYPKTKNPKKHHKHTGPWAIFQKTAYAINQQRFYYALLNGRDAAKVALSRVDKHMEPRLRYGSQDKILAPGVVDEDFNLVTKVQRKLKEEGFYLIPIDGDFGYGTFKALVAFQKKNLGAQEADGIVGPVTAKKLGIPWPNKDFDLQVAAADQ